MEIDKTVRTLSNFLKKFEKKESCILSIIFARSLDAKEQVEKLIDNFRNEEFFTSATEYELRSLHFFLLLNTDLGITEELESNPEVGHAIGAVPSLSPYVYLMLCTDVDLTRYLKESIEFCPVGFVIHILKSINDNLKYLSPSHYFNVLATVLAALLIRFRKTEEVCVSQSLYDNLQVFFLHYKEDEIATDFHSRLSSGYKWLSLLRLLRIATRIRFSTKLKVEPISFYDFEMSNDSVGETNKNSAIEEFYDRIFLKCRAFADVLDMNLYMAWHEIEDDGDTLQNIIGIEAYKLRSSLEKYQKHCTLPTISSELVEILKSVQKVPHRNTPTKEEKLDKNELEETISKKSDFDSKFIADAEILIKEDATALNFDMAKTFINKLCSNCAKGVKEENLKNIIWLVLRHMEFGQISSFVGEFIENHGLHNLLYQSTVDLSSQIEQMNATNIDDEEASVKIFKEIILSVFSTAPHVLAIMIREGCAEKNKQSKIVDLLDTLKTVCLYDTEDSSSTRKPLLMNVVQNFFESCFMELEIVQRHYFFELLVKLCHKNLLQENAILHDCLLRSLSIREKANWQILSEILAFLKTFVRNNRDKLTLNLRNLLLQLLHVVESARWNIITFTPERLKACEEGIEVIELIRELFPVSENATEMEQILTNHTYRFSDLTQLYFVDVCPAFRGDSIQSRLVSLICEPLRQSVDSFIIEYEANQATFTLRLGELLPRLTSKEMRMMVDHYAAGSTTNLIFIFDMMSHGISFIGSCAANYSKMPQAKSNAIISCVGQMLNNFLVILQAHWSVFLAANQRFYFVKYVKRIAAVLQAFPSHQIQPYQFNLIKFVDDSLLKLKADHSETEMTDSMIQEFDRNIRQLFVGFTLL